MAKFIFMKKTLLFLFFFLQFFIISAQNPTDVEREYGSYPGFADGNVYSAAIQPDGKMIIGGSFTSYKGDNDSNNLIRLNPDGTKDKSFTIGAGFSNGIMYPNYVSSIILQDDGKLIVGGVFTKFQGFPQNYIIRLNSDGSKDTSFNFGTGFMDNPNGNSTILTMVKQNDGKILIGGGFLGYQGAADKYLIRLNADGTKDTSFDIGTGFNSTVNSIVLQNDGKIIVSGEFTRFQGASQSNIIRLNADGSKDTSFNVFSGFNGIVKSVLIQPDGKIVVGGYFTRYINDTRNGVIRLNSDGSNDTTFNISTGFGFAPGVTSLGLQPDGKIIVGGYFRYYKGISQNHLIRLNADGTKDDSFEVGTGYGVDETKSISFIIVRPNGKILTGGYFDSYQDITVNKLVSLNNDGSRDIAVETGNGFNNSVDAIVQQTDGKMVVGGQFSNYQQTSQNCLVRINSDNSIDKSFNIGTGFYNYWGGHPTIQTVALQTDGKIIAGGRFTSYKDVSQGGLIRLNNDGTKDDSFNVGSGFAGSYGTNKVQVIVIQPDGKIIVASDYFRYNEVTNNYLIRLNPDGSMDKSFNIGSGFNTVVESIVLQEDGKIIVGGQFTKFQGVAQNHLIRLNPDGTKDDSFNIGTGFNNPVLSLALQKDGKLLVAGEFSSFQNKTEKYLIRLNSDGSQDDSFKTGTGFNSYVLGIAIQADDKIIVGGQFTAYQNSFQNRVARLNTDGSPDIPFNQAIGKFNSDSKVNKIKILPDGQIILAGNFTAYNENNRSAYIMGLEGDYIATPLISKITPTNITCSAISGEASIAVNGGKSPYTYLWSNGATTTKITGLVPGNYSCKVTDADLTTITENFEITLTLDTEKPTITAPVDVSLNISSGCTLSGVVLGNPITADNCSIASVTNDAPADFPVGNTTVIWTVKDDSNNTATATQIVTVKDIALPTIKAPANLVVNTICTTADVVLENPVTADNCTVVTITNNAPSVFPLGNSIVTWTVKDASNNIATAKQIVTVKRLDVKVIINAGILTATETEGTYKWFECKNGSLIEIPNENKISFTPIKVGSYAVEITKNGCSATSTCYEVKTLGIKDFDLENSLKLYPNPSKDFVTIEINHTDDTKLRIFDINGNSILSKELTNGSNTINISHLSVGVYMFEISNETGKTIKKVIKK